MWSVPGTAADSAQLWPYKGYVEKSESGKGNDFFRDTPFELAFWGVSHLDEPDGDTVSVRSKT